MAAVPCVVGCSDDGDDGLPGTGGGNPEEGEYLNADSMNYERVKSNLFVADTLSPGAVKYTPRSGEVLDNAFPEVYSIGVDSVEEALSFFYTNCVPIGEEDKVASEDGALVYDLGDYGRLVYREGDGRDELASVEIRLTGVEDVSRISFIPMSQWPNNAESPFYVGNVLVDDEKGWWWLCVRACEGGKSGILMTFDGGWEETERDDHYKEYTKVKGCASKEAWNALAQFYYSSPTDFRAFYKKLASIGASYNFRMRALDALNRNLGEIHQVGDMWDNKYYWAGRIRRVWEGSTDYVKVGESYIYLENGMPVFQSGNYYFKRNWSPVVPDWRQSHSVTFTSWDGSVGKYTLKYPENGYK